MNTPPIVKLRARFVGISDSLRGLYSSVFYDIKVKQDADFKIKVIRSDDMSPEKKSVQLFNNLNEFYDKWDSIRKYLI